MLSKAPASQLINASAYTADDDDDFQIPPTQTLSASLKPTSHKTPLKLKPSNTPRSHPPLKKRKRLANPGKENAVVLTVTAARSDDLVPDLDDTCGLDSIDCSFDLISAQNRGSDIVECEEKKNESSESTKGYSCNSIESKLIRPVSELSEGFSDDCEEDNELDELLKLCNEEEEEEEEEEASQEEVSQEDNNSILCPLCGVDISDLNE